MNYSDELIATYNNLKSCPESEKVQCIIEVLKQARKDDEIMKMPGHFLDQTKHEFRTRYISDGHITSAQLEEALTRI